MSGYAQGQAQGQQPHPGDAWVQKVSKGKHQPGANGSGGSGGSAGPGQARNLIQLYTNPSETRQALAHLDELLAKHVKMAALHGKPMDLAKEVAPRISKQLHEAIATAIGLAQDCQVAAVKIRNGGFAERVSAVVGGKHQGAVADEVEARADGAMTHLNLASQAIDHHQFAGGYSELITGLRTLQTDLGGVGEYYGKAADGAGRVATTMQVTRDVCIGIIGLIALPALGPVAAGIAGTLPALAKLQDHAVAHEPINWTEFGVDAVAGALLSKFETPINAKLGAALEHCLGPIGTKLLASPHLKPEQVERIIKAVKDKGPDMIRNSAHSLAVSFAKVATEREHQKGQSATVGSLRDTLSDLAHHGKVPDEVKHLLEKQVSSLVAGELKKLAAGKP